MDAKVCVRFILCENREGLVFEVNMLCLYIWFEEDGL